MSKKLNHIFTLDSIRGTAALMVMIFHAWEAGILNHFPIVSKIAKVSILGQTGVDLFFVLSGFLITRILLASKGEGRYFENFYLRRVLRIFPLYYLFLALYYMIVPLIDNRTAADIGHGWWFWVYLQNIPLTFRGLQAGGPNHFWSLAVEEHFYLIWPLLVYLIPERKLRSASVALIAAAFAVRALFIYGLHLDVFYFTLCRMDALAFGTLLACLEFEGAIWNLRRFFGWSFLAGSGLMAGLWAAGGQGEPFIQLIKYTIIAFFYWALLGWIVSAKPRFNPAFLKYSGRISYGLYVYHPLCYLIVFKFISIAVHPFLAFVTAVTFSFAISSVSFYFYETPFLKLKKYFSSPVPEGIAVAQTG